MMTQALMLAKKPHIIIATPGRLVDHLENTKGFNLRSLKFLVMDEADRILNMDFEQEVDKILKVQISDVIVLDINGGQWLNGRVLDSRPRLAKCRQISIFAMPVAFTGKYREILTNIGKYWQI